MAKRDAMLKREAPHVVIIGCGFGGLAAARTLKGSDVRVTMIDRTNHHLFQPLLYQVATAALAAPDIAAPVRTLLSRQPNATVWLAQVERIDVEKRQVLAQGKRLDYDYLIVASGMRHGYFGHDAWAAVAPGLKTLGEALDIRRRILRAFEAAEFETSPEERRAWTTFVVIGGGPTGVEMAGALAEIAGARWHTSSGASIQRPRAWCWWRQGRGSCPALIRGSPSMPRRSCVSWASTCERAWRCPS
jgi:NADH dehydrogenase